MPLDAGVIHRLCEYFLNTVRSEVFCWQSLFQMFTGCRSSELRRLRLDAKAGEPGHIANGFLHLGRRSKSGVNPYCPIGPEFGQMLNCFHRWHTARHPRAKVYFPGPFGDVVDAGSHGHALSRACGQLALPKITPHGFRAYYVTKRRRDGAMDSHVAAEIGDKTVALISQTYGDEPGGKPLAWTPEGQLPVWLRWQPEAAKIERIA
jgi:integrase